MKGYLLAEGKRLVLAVLAFLVVFAAVPGLRLVHLLGCWRQGSVRWGCCTGTPRPGSLAG